MSVTLCVCVQSFDAVLSAATDGSGFPDYRKHCRKLLLNGTERNVLYQNNPYIIQKLPYIQRILDFLCYIHAKNIKPIKPRKARCQVTKVDRLTPTRCSKSKQRRSQGIHNERDWQNQFTKVGNEAFGWRLSLAISRYQVNEWANLWLLISYTKLIVRRMAVTSDGIKRGVIRYLRLFWVNDAKQTKILHKKWR